jgi:hypothetical protein
MKKNICLAVVLGVDLIVGFFKVDFNFLESTFSRPLVDKKSTPKKNVD